ncbi:MAG: PAS domain-containing protein [Anaerolineales bacterium]|nr:PAS domain-containing protein [Anaerolineales bacterium]
MSDKRDLCRRLFETAGEALLVIQAGQIVEANASAAALLGCSQETLLNQTLLHFSPLTQPDGNNSAQALPEKMAAALAGRPQRFEWLCQTSMGETVFTEIALSGVEFEGKAYLQASIHDISPYKQAEAELIRGRNLLRSLIDKLPDTHAFVKDTASRFIFTNAAHLNVIGVDRLDQVLGKTDFDLFPQELAEQYFADEQAVIRSGQPLLNIVEPAVDSAGHKKWYLTNKIPLFDENNQIIGLVGMSLDITKRKEAEESLRQSQQLLQVVMDNIPQSIFWKDNNLTYLGCNRAFAEDASLSSPEAIIGKTDFEMVWREQAELYQADDRQVMEMGQPKLNYEEPQTTAAGTRIWLRTSKVPIHDAEGKVVAVLGMYEDITEQKRAEEALQESERRLANIINFLPSPTFVIDREGKVIAWNHAIEEALGVKAEDVLGKGNYEYALPFYGERRPILIDLVFEPLEKIEQKYFNVRREGDTLSAEAHVFPRGQERYFVGTAAPMYDAQGNVIGAIQTLRDATEQKQSELALQESERRLGDIINFLPGPTFVIDREGKVIAWNQAIAEVTGVKAEDILGKGDYEYALPFFGERRPLLIDLIFEPEEEVAKNYINVRREGRSLLAENRVFLRGIERYYDLSAAGLYDSQGNMVGAIEAFRDVTEQKQAEEELKKYRDRLEDLVEARTEELEDRVRELNALQRLMSREGWQAFQSVREQATSAYLYDQTSVQATTMAELGLVHNGNTQKESASQAAAGNGHIAKPIAVHGEFIGALGIQTKGGEPLPPEDQAFLDAVAEQVAEALERSRLLEQTQKRAVEMETVAQVSTVISTILDTNQLLQKVADLTKTRFGLYHAHIYLLNETGDTLKLAAGAGEVGRRMLVEGWNIPLAHERSLVVRAARSRQGVMVNDVRQDPGFMPNPLLPDTAAELAVPIVIGDGVLGVLDVQADVIGRFTGDDVRVMTTLTSQVAVALQNAGQYQQTETALADVEQSQQLLRSIIDATPDWIFVKDREHRYRLVNQSYANSMHVPVDEFIGKNDLDIGFPEEIVKGNPEKGIRGFWTDDGEVMDSGQIRVIDVEPGVVDDQPVFLSTIKVPLRDADGEVWGVLGFVRDITQREQLLAQSENLFKASRRLNEARDLQELVAAVAEGGPAPVTNRAGLLEFEYNSLGQVEAMASVANWFNGQGTPPPPLGFRVERSANTLVSMFLNPEPTFFDDVQHDEGVDPVSLALAEKINMRALAVLPLQAGARQWGVLVLDGEEPYHFTEQEMQPYIALARQLAVALENRHLLAEAQAALTEVERTQRRYTVQAWETYRDRLATLSYEQVREGVTPLGDNLLPEITQVMTERRAVIGDQPSGLIDPGSANETDTGLIVPLTVRGEMIGVLGLQETDERRVWSPEEIALIEAISEQFVQAAENIRLIDETQQRAAREKRVNEIGEKIQAAQSLEEALKIAVKEVGLSLQAPQTVVKLEVK